MEVYKIKEDEKFNPADASYVLIDNLTKTDEIYPSLWHCRVLRYDGSHANQYIINRRQYSDYTQNRLDKVIEPEIIAKFMLMWGGE